MQTIKSVGKREFIHHTSKYLNWVEEGKELIITHQNHPDLILSKIKPKSFKSLAGFCKINIISDINEHVLPGYDEW